MTKEEALDIISDAGFGFFATVEDNKPCVRPMMPYLTEDGDLLLAMLGRSRTIPQIKANPRVEVCFVDRKMWYCRVSGIATMSDDISKKQIVFENVPMLRQYFAGPEDPNFQLAVIEIKSVEAMTPHSRLPEAVNLSNPMPENKRQFKRVEKPISVQFRVEDVIVQKWDMSFVKNISVGGIMFLATNSPKLEKDKILELKIKLPDLAPATLDIYAVICSIKSYPSSSKLCEVRAKFNVVSEKDKRLLLMVESMMKRKAVKNIVRRFFVNVIDCF